MKRNRATALRVLILLLALASLAQTQPAQAAATTLWSVGIVDGDFAEFALAPAGWASYPGDASVLIGVSQPQAEWPYVLPGPADGWGGSRTHTLSAVFALASVDASDTGAVIVDLVDTHPTLPPTVRLSVNGHSQDFSLPAGGTGNSIYGFPAEGHRYSFQMAVPAAWLIVGENTLEIQNLNGSWLLFDAVRMTAATGTQLGTEATVIGNTFAVRGLVEEGGEARQPIEVQILRAGPAVPAQISAAGTSATVSVPEGRTTARLLVPPVAVEQAVSVRVDVAGRTTTTDVTLKPVKKVTLYVLNHSHTDIGYTESQAKVEEKQINNMLEAIEFARATKENPAGSRFIWNVEASWAADVYQRKLSAEQRALFDETVKDGGIALQGLYGNILTGLTTPEQLLRMTEFSSKLARRLGVKLDAAMISDVPGYTWGTVNTLAQAGIRYFSVAPNNFDRIGDILVQWTNKPFWWVSQSGKDRVLVWIPYKGYAYSHGEGALSASVLDGYQSVLFDESYPYDISYIRWAGHGDNAAPERQTADFAKEWNSKYTWPRVVISDTSTAFAAFEARYGDQLPEHKGDLNPYWEDGAGSSAAETALNRESSDRLAQAQALYAMRSVPYSGEAFSEAWHATLLYAEHTWGAWCSVSDPENPLTHEVWEGKKGFALDADQRSRALLDQVLNSNADPASQSFDVYNTTSWTRTDLVLLSPEQSQAGDRVVAEDGSGVPSQRLASGQLAFVATDVPAFAARRFSVVAGQPEASSPVAVSATGLDNGLVNVGVDAVTGAISSLGGKDITGNLIDGSNGEGANDYLYFLGNDPNHAVRNGRVTIVAEDSGPLVGSLRVASEAPGCNSLVRHVRVVAGLDRVDLTDQVDKKRAPVTPGHIDYAQPTSKESLNLAFPFAIPGGQMYIDGPFSVVRPDQDLLPGSCKNWLSVGRWVEIANQDAGVTWAALDTPLIQVGGLTANLLNSQTDPSVWRMNIDPTQKFYVWAMNNHWGTNYRAYQEGPVTFRFSMRPHRGLDLAESARFGTGHAQPLLVAPASSSSTLNKPFVTVSSPDVLVMGLKPSEDGQGWIVRLFGASGEDRQVELGWASTTPMKQWRSDSNEQKGEVLPTKLDVPAWGLVTVRAELGEATDEPDPDPVQPSPGSGCGCRLYDRSCSSGALLAGLGLAALLWWRRRRR